MRVASNKLKDIIAFFYTELESIYEAPEIEAMANLAVEHYLGFSPTEGEQKANANVNQSDLLKLYDCAKALKEHKPLQYILGQAWFYNLKFNVSPAVLIPRPETEELVDMILKENTPALCFLDIGTGSGCIPVTIKHKLPNAEVHACDISREALLVAQQNANLNNAAVTFFEADVLNIKIFESLSGKKFDVIVSNPPYIKDSEKAAITKHVIDQEPHLALFVEGDDDIVFYKKIIDLAASKLNDKGRVYFELNPLTALAVQEYAIRSNLFATAALIKDMSGKVRFFKGIKKQLTP